MKRIFLFISLLFCFLSIKAQLQPYLKPIPQKFNIIPNSNKSLHIDSFLVLLNKRSYTHNNDMPNALVINGRLLQDKLILKGNNSKGFNIFESSIDRMKIIINDSSTIAK